MSYELGVKSYIIKLNGRVRYGATRNLDNHIICFFPRLTHEFTGINLKIAVRRYNL